MREIHHPNIVSYHDSFEYKNRFLVIIMEFCETGSLKNYIQMSATIPERECLEIGEQLCSALKVYVSPHYYDVDVQNRHTG